MRSNEHLSTHSRGTKLMFWAALTFAAALVSLWLDSVPGLHGDEAWVGTSAHDILNGGRPILGMNGYTGAIHQYLAAVFLRAFGLKVWALRGFGALSSLLSVGLYFACIKRLWNAQVAALSALLLTTMPFFVGFSRIANEVFMLNPLLALSSAYLVLSAQSRSPRVRWLFFFGSGVLIGVGIWTHLIFLSFAFALGTAALFRKRWRLFTTSPLYLTCVGALAGLSPRIRYQLHASESLKKSLGLSSSPHDFMGPVIDRLREWPGVFLQTLHGDTIFQRFTGTVLFRTPNVTAALWMASAVFLIVKAVRKGPRSVEALLLVFNAALMIATLVMSPGNSERYFLLILYCAPLFLAFLIRVMLPGRALSWVLPLLVIFQLSRIGINYFDSFLESGGRTSTFWLGGQSENSSHYVETHTLYDKLVELGATQVCSEFLLLTPLEFYKLSSPHPFDTSWDQSVCLKMAAEGAPTVYAAVYQGDDGVFKPADFPGFKTVFSDSHFIVFRGGR